MGYLTMSDKELKQAKMFELLKSRKIGQKEAAVRLDISPRWIRKKLKRYLEDGDKGLIHGSRGRASPRSWDEKEKKLLIELLGQEWKEFGPTFAAEKLEELHGIEVSKETVRKAMIEAGIWKAKSVRSKHRQRRERRALFGAMIQLDGSPHDWFEGRGPRCCLIVFIDDATSQIVWMAFAPSESNESLMRATKDYVQAHGSPKSFYVDHGSVFHVNLNNQENDKKTQWERACTQLGIEVIHAHSPQAKGRVERCNKTMQDRLVKDMRLAKICSIEQANEFLKTSKFIEEHNAKYAVKPSQEGSAHSDISGHDLDDIFSIHEERVLTNDFTVMFGKKIFQLHEQQPTIIRPKNRITVKVSLSGDIALWIRKTKLNFSEILHKPIKPVQEEKPKSNRVHKPSESSKRWVGGLPPLSRVKPASPAVEAINCE